MTQELPEMKRALPVLLAIALSVPGGPGVAEGDPAVKLLELEARIDQLARRVDVLEAGALAGTDSGPGVRLGKDLAWHLDGYLAESPFKVSQQELDRTSGRVDLLLNLITEPADGDLWRAAQTGDPVPIEVTATLAGGGTAGPVPFTLHRRTNFDIGTHVHVLAQLPVEDAKAIRRLSVRHTGPR
jgi:hypothetical protein